MNSDCRSVDPRFDRRRVPLVVVQWLLLIAATFVAGSLTMVLLPSHRAKVFNYGVFINVAMAIGIGVVLTWRGNPRRLICAAGLGAVVTVVGWDFLSITQTEIQDQGGLGVILLDVFFLPIALCGMAILLGLGAALGGIGRLISSRSPCGKWLPWLGPPVR